MTKIKNAFGEAFFMYLVEHNTSKTPHQKMMAKMAFLMRLAVHIYMMPLSVCIVNLVYYFFSAKIEHQTESGVLFWLKRRSRATTARVVMPPAPAGGCLLHRTFQ